VAEAMEFRHTIKNSKSDATGFVESGFWEFCAESYEVCGESNGYEEDYE
jgi:hypothetical protein